MSAHRVNQRIQRGRYYVLMVETTEARADTARLPFPGDERRNTGDGSMC